MSADPQDDPKPTIILDTRTGDIRIKLPEPDAWIWFPPPLPSTPPVRRITIHPGGTIVHRDFEGPIREGERVSVFHPEYGAGELIGVGNDRTVCVWRSDVLR